MTDKIAKVEIRPLKSVQVYERIAYLNQWIADIHIKLNKVIDKINNQNKK